jgi:hypothetical protein
LRQVEHDSDDLTEIDAFKLAALFLSRIKFCFSTAFCQRFLLSAGISSSRGLFGMACAFAPNVAGSLFRFFAASRTGGESSGT